MEAHPPSRCRNAKSPRTFSGRGPYSSLPTEALRRLGVDVDASVRDLQSAYRRLMPDAATSGYLGALRTAVAHGVVKPSDAEDQMRWLAAQLRLERPADDDPWPWWSRAWRDAARIARVKPPPRLNESARRVLLQELLARPDYAKRLADSLAAAFRAQLKR
jgi:hypothetical protein